MIACSGVGSRPVRVTARTVYGSWGQCRACERVVALDEADLIGWHVNHRGWAP